MFNVRTLVNRRREQWNAGVVHATLDPGGPGAVRIHLVPPKPTFLGRAPSILFLNGYYAIPIGPSWAVLLRIFLEELNTQAVPGEEITGDRLDQILQAVAMRMNLLYPRVRRERFLGDLDEIVGICIAVVRGEDVPEIRSNMSLGDYTKYMKAPHRMDLIISPMLVGQEWQCPLHCRVCYAAGQPAMKVDRELTTAQWKAVIDRCRQAGIPQVSFTGGEPTKRRDLVELVTYAAWHVTRLNTSGVTMTPALARALSEASLDVVQITLYSDDSAAHDELVGTRGAWELTVAGIKNAVAAGLSVSINTPLVKLNSRHPKTLQFIRTLNVRFVSCSGLIPAGAANTHIDRGEALSNSELFAIMQESVATARELGMELMFTSPGWLTPNQLQSLGLSEPICGACLNNMAVAPSGVVVPCQSWLGDLQGLGNILTTPWKKVWNHPLCKEMRKASPEGCPLKEVV